MHWLLIASLLSWSALAGEPDLDQNQVVQGILEFKVSVVGGIFSNDPAAARESVARAKDELDKQLNAAFGRKARWQEMPTLLSVVDPGFPGPTPSYQATLRGKVRVLLKSPLRRYRVDLDPRPFSMQETARQWDAIYAEEQKGIQSEKKDLEELLDKNLVFFHALQSVGADSKDQGAFRTTLEVFYQE